jgi:hypothetical protein
MIGALPGQGAFSGWRLRLKRFISWWCSLFGLKDQVLINLVTAIVAAAALIWAASTALSIVVGLGFRALT